VHEHIRNSPNQTLKTKIKAMHKNQNENQNEAHTIYNPLPAAAIARLSSLPKCAYVTAGPRSYIRGMSCIAKRLEAVGAHYPLLTMVEEEDETFMRANLHVNNHAHSMVLPWHAFPANSTHVIGIRGERTMDKMNLFGLPLRRIVWIDADMYVRENIDELCELPVDVHFAAALNAARGRPTYVWPSRSASRHCIRQFNITENRLRYVARSAADLRPRPNECPYIFQTGAMVITPLNLARFNAEVVGPLQHSSVQSYDGTDQGAINTLLYGAARIFGDAYARLHARYNVIARHRSHSEVFWNGLPSALVHHTGKSGRPWQSSSNMSEWHGGCATAVARL